MTPKLILPFVIENVIRKFLLAEILDSKRISVLMEQAHEEKPHHYLDITGVRLGITKIHHLSLGVPIILPISHA